MRTVYIRPDGALILRGKSMSPLEVRRTLGCGTVLVRSTTIKMDQMHGFMNGINALQGVGCLRVGLLVEDAPVGKK